MLLHKKLYLYLTKESLAVTTFSKKNQNIETLKHYNWSDTTLHELFIALKKEYNSSIFKLVVAEEFSYVSGIIMPGIQEHSKKEVLKQFQEQVPELIDPEIWNYSFLMKNKKTTLYQAFTIERKLWKILKQAAIAAKINFESIVPASLALSETLSKYTSTNIIIYSKEETFAAITRQGNVFGSVTFSIDQENAQEKIKQLILQIKQKFSITPLIVITSDTTLFPELEAKKDRYALGTDMHPLLGIYKMHDNSKNVLGSLNLQQKSKKTFSFLLLLIILGLIGLYFGYILSKYFI